MACEVLGFACIPIDGDLLLHRSRTPGLREQALPVSPPDAGRRRAGARSWGQRGQQGGRVVAAAVHHAVDEQGGGAEHLARGQAAVDVAADPVGYRGAGPVAVEGRDVQAEPPSSDP